jgi:predicted outer membrane protein
MKTPRKMLTSAILAVAFLSAGAFAQGTDTTPTHTNANVTVIAKTAETSFAL